MFKAAGTQFVFLAVVILTVSSKLSSAPLREDLDPSTFLERGIEMSYAAIHLADLAMSKAEEDRVRQFANIMAGRQKQVLQTLQDPHQKNQVRGIAFTAVARTALTTEHQQALERLSLVSGRNFDHEFIDAIVYEYRRTVRLFEQEAGISTPHQNKLRRTAPPTPGEMAELARDLLPFLREQLSDAESIQRELQPR